MSCAGYFGRQKRRIFHHSEERRRTGAIDPNQIVKTIDMTWRNMVISISNIMISWSNFYKHEFNIVNKIAKMIFQDFWEINFQFCESQKCDFLKQVPTNKIENWQFLHKVYHLEAQFLNIYIFLEK